MAIKIKTWHSVTVCGMKGTGKSNLERFLLKMYPAVFVFDVLEEFQDYPNYVPKTNDPRELDSVAKAIWAQGNVTLLVSEAELFLPNSGTLPPNIFRLLTRGRHRNIGVIVDTRRIANLSKTAFSLSEHVFVFRHFSPTDLRYLQEFMPVDVHQLATLPDYHFWHYTKGVVKEHEPVPRMTVPKVKKERKEGDQ